MKRHSEIRSLLSFLFKVGILLLLLLYAVYAASPHNESQHLNYTSARPAYQR